MIFLYFLFFAYITFLIIIHILSGNAIDEEINQREF